MTSIVPSPPETKLGQRVDPPRLRAATVAACLAVVGRIVIAPLVFAVFVSSTRYIKKGEVFIVADEAYFAFRQMDAVMAGGCSNCSVSCRYAFTQLSRFNGSALMSKPAFENMFKVVTFDDSLLSEDAMSLANVLDFDPDADCINGVDDWASPITAIAADPERIVDVVRVLNISVSQQQLLEVTNGIKMKDACKTRWILETNIRLFRFPTAVHSIEFSSVSAADFIIFPEYTECRGDGSTDGIGGSKLALATSGTDLLRLVPKVLMLFPYYFKSSLPPVPRLVPAENTIYNAKAVHQPSFHAYFGACRVREVNTTGIYIEDTCTVDNHWVNYGLMLQSPDDIPVCSTGDVCVHNNYNSLWEFVVTRDTTTPGRFSIVINVFRTRYADPVRISVLPGVVVLQILFMGMVSLYQTMAHKRSVLLTQIWAYRCQTGRMQLWYLVQISYHLVYNSDLYYLGLTTGTLSIESIGNLTMSFFGFTYTLINLVKPRAGAQRLDRFFRLMWEIIQLFMTGTVGLLLYLNRMASLTMVMEKNGELLRKTTVRGEKYCNLSDSCIVFRINLGLVVFGAALTLVFVPFLIGCYVEAQARQRHRAMQQYGINYFESVRHKIAILRFRKTPAQIAAAPPTPPREEGDSQLTSFERHCLGGRFTRLFHDCDDFNHVTHQAKQCSSVEAVLLAGFVYYGNSLYKAPAVLLLLLARVMPRAFLRTFSVILIRWPIDPETGMVSPPLGCTWYKASMENHRLSRAVPIR
jgi:hypothetical protein